MTATNYDTIVKALTAYKAARDSGQPTDGVPALRGEKGQSLRWRGVAAPTAAYDEYDIVTCDGAAFICTKATIGGPPSMDWETLVFPHRGERGERGERGPKGEPGETGPRGATGATGAQGPRGLQGSQGERGVTWRGNFVAGDQYAQGDLVAWMDAIYLAVEPTAASPDGFGWVEFSKRGERGPAGFRGETGEITATSGVITTTNTTASLSSTTGALIVAGGAGFASDINIASVRVGHGAGGGVTNAAVGKSAFASNTAGEYSTAVGAYALYASTSGTYNTAVGGTALLSNTSGTNNCAFGATSLQYNTTGSGNTAVGLNALGNNVATSNNVAVGLYALYTHTASSGNVAVGAYSLFSSTAGGSSAALGYRSGRYYGAGTDELASASQCVFIGASSRASATPATNEIVIGYNAVGIGENCTVIGNSSCKATQIAGVISTDLAALTVASAATIATSQRITFVSGSAAIATITPPAGIATTGGTITLIPTGAFTTTTAGNIMIASTAVVNRALMMTYDAGTGKWYPSY